MIWAGAVILKLESLPELQREFAKAALSAVAKADETPGSDWTWQRPAELPPGEFDLGVLTEQIIELASRARPPDAKHLDTDTVRGFIAGPGRKAQRGTRKTLRGILDLRPDFFRRWNEHQKGRQAFRLLAKDFSDDERKALAAVDDSAVMAQLEAGGATREQVRATADSALRRLHKRYGSKAGPAAVILGWLGLARAHAGKVAMAVAAALVVLLGPWWRGDHGSSTVSPTTPEIETGAGHTESTPRDAHTDPGGVPEVRSVAPDVGSTDWAAVAQPDRPEHFTVELGLPEGCGVIDARNIRGEPYEFVVNDEGRLVIRLDWKPMYREKVGHPQVQLELDGCDPCRFQLETRGVEKDDHIPLGARVCAPGGSMPFVHVRGSLEGPGPPISVVPRGATSVQASTLGTFIQGDRLSDERWKWVTEHCEKRPTLWYCPTGFPQASPAERGVRKTDPSLFNE